MAKRSLVPSCSKSKYASKAKRLLNLEATRERLRIKVWKTVMNILLKRFSVEGLDADCVKTRKRSRRREQLPSTFLERKGSVTSLRMARREDRVQSEARPDDEPDMKTHKPESPEARCGPGMFLNCSACDKVGLLCAALTKRGNWAPAACERDEVQAVNQLKLLEKITFIQHKHNISDDRHGTCKVGEQFTALESSRST